MAHELELNQDGTARMLFVKHDENDVPWHLLGNHLKEPPKNMEEAMELSGLNWTVDTLPLIAEKDGQKLSTNAMAVVRSTDNKVLGVVGDTYKPVQNKDAFNMFDKAIEEGLVSIDTAGSLRGGSRIWVMARINDSTAEIVKGDPINPYFLFSNSHDGTLAVSVGYTTTRVVCMNTLQISLKDERSHLLKVRHTKNVDKALEKIKEIVDWRRRTFTATVEQMQFLAKVGCNEENLRKYVEVVFEPEIKNRSKDEDSADESYEKLFDKILPFWESGKGTDIPGVRGTMWGGYMAVNEYLNYGRGRSTDTRMDALWFGQTKKVNERAFEVALQMAA